MPHHLLFGQQDSKSSAFSRFRMFDKYLSGMVVFHYSLSQTEPKAPASLFSRKPRCKYFIPITLGDTLARIYYINAEGSTFFPSQNGDASFLPLYSV